MSDTEIVDAFVAALTEANRMPFVFLDTVRVVNEFVDMDGLWPVEAFASALRAVGGQS